MAEDPLHVRQCYTGLKQIRRAAVPELMNTDVADASVASESAHAVANRLRSDGPSAPADQEGALGERTVSLELVMPQRQVSLEAAARQVRHGDDAFASGLAPVNAQQSLLSIPAIDGEALELASTKSGAI